MMARPSPRDGVHFAFLLAFPCQFRAPTLREDAAAMSSLALGTLIFILVYVLIVVEKWHKTVVALAGASAVLLLKLVTQDEAFHSQEYGVDWNVIFLLIGMMIIVNIVRETGVFQWTAIKSAKLGKGEPFRIMAILAVVTAVVSAFLDNVTTVLLIAPITIVVANELDVDPIPFMIVEALASNIGGTATLIGDPPNIMIGSRAELPFNAFVEHLTPVILLVLFAFVVTIRFIWGKNMRTRPELKARILAMNESEAITDRPLLRKCLVVVSLMIVGFVLHSALGFEPATIALCGAGLLLVISFQEPHKVLREVEWTGVDPLSWTPDPLGEGGSRWQRPTVPIPRSSAAA
jgi:Na+/H+ antiporter NhaD/arsenite permease-like protein